MNGIVFYIADDAYLALNRYLDTLKEYFVSQPDGVEVIGDIEARIAELFSEKCRSAQVVISLADVDEVKKTLGTPEDIADVNVGAAHDKSAGSPETPPGLPPSLGGIPRKFYRDPDRRFLGGVCAGLAVWWNIPVWLVRLLWVVLTFMPWPGFWFPHPPGTLPLMILLYVALWIFVKKANTPARKLSMMGMPVNVEGLRSLREQSGVSGATGNAYAPGTPGVYQTISRGREVFTWVLQKSFGVLFLLSGVFLLGTVVLTLMFQEWALQDEWEYAYYPVSDLVRDMFPAAAVMWWKVLAALAILIPVFLLVSLGLRLLLRKFAITPLVWGSLAGLWFFVMIAGALLTFRQVSSYSYSEAPYEVFDLPVPDDRDTLEIRLKDGPMLANSILGAFYDPASETYSGMPRVFVEPSRTDEWSVCVHKRSQGRSRMEARERAAGINYAFQMDGAWLLLDRYFSVTPQDKWAIQSVEYTIRVPEGKYVRLDSSMKPYYGEYGWSWDREELVLKVNEHSRVIPQRFRDRHTQD